LEKVNGNQGEISVLDVFLEAHLETNPIEPGWKEGIIVFCQRNFSCRSQLVVYEI
jgi:hypothetical protein